MIDMTKIPPFNQGQGGRPTETTSITPTQPYEPTMSITGQSTSQQWGVPGGNTNIWNNQEWNKDFGVTPEQSWYRNPTWGDHIVWNQDKGFQDYNTVGNLYKSGGDYNTLTTQQGDNWSQWFPDRKVSTHAEKQAMDGVPGYGGNQGGFGICGGGQGGGQVSYNQGQNMNTQGGQVPGMPTQGGNPQMGVMGAPVGQPVPQGGNVGNGFQHPDQWGTASDVFTRFAQGLPTQQPWQWQEGSDVASQMASGGMPTSYEPMYQQAKSIAQRDTDQAIKQAAEQAGLSGLRWSTPLGQTAQRIAGENMANLGLGFAGQEMGAQEAARNRMMGATDQLYNFGQGTAGLTEAAKNRGMQAAGGLTGLGQQYLNAPQDWAAQMYQMGGGMQNQAQGGMDRYYGDFMRGSTENNPFINAAMNYFGTPSQMGYQQYNPSTMSQVGGVLGGLGTLGLGIC